MLLCCLARPRQPRHAGGGFPFRNQASDRGLSYVNGTSLMGIADRWLLAAFAAAMALNGLLAYWLYLAL
jgi:hypothetical protein